ncbi:MAG: ABC transporter ATP-binding protein [Blastocatellia bacterium]|nr:ABC transporter ATP-binding protein [Blastocatellia bacterium]
MPILESHNVTKEYPMGSEEVHALNGVTVAIEPGEFVAILGTSGSGKSTLLNLFGGLDRPTKGDILFNGQSLAPLSSREMSRYRLRSIGMIFQSFNLIPTMTARQNVSLALAFAGMKQTERQQRSRELLERVGLGARVDHRPSELSGGEQQRVSIARALANEPQVLLADEPTGNLDSARAAEILELLKTMQREGKTIVMVTHDQELAGRFADRIIKLKDGKLAE